MNQASPLQTGRRIVPLLFAIALLSCTTSKLPPIETMPRVDLDRFMGDWYVIANIPTRLERAAHNAVESYERDPDGTIRTTFTFRDGGFDGEDKRYSPRGFVYDDSNAVWGMQFVWPIKADYRILFVDQDYSQTVIGRNARDYVWIMARTPTIPEEDLRTLTALIAERGYDVTKLRKVPQHWE